MTPDLQSLIDQVAHLQRRVMLLEAWRDKAGGISHALLEFIRSRDDEFSTTEALAAIEAAHPELVPVKHSTVSSILSKFTRQLRLIQTERGGGPKPSRFVRSTAPAANSRVGHRAPNESGARGLIREAIAVLPEPFTVAQARAWVKTEHPEADVPRGSWWANFKALESSGELVLEHRGRRGENTNPSTFRRGPVRISSSGAEMTKTEERYRDFTATIERRAA